MTTNSLLTTLLSSPFAILSACKEYYADDSRSFLNQLHTMQLVNLLRRNGYIATVVQGKYRDVAETSVLVQGTPENGGWSMHELVRAFAQTFDQESYILCDGTGEALLLSTQKTCDVLARFRSVREARPSDSSYTELPCGTRIVFE